MELTEKILKNIQSDFADRVEESQELAKVLKQVKNGTATYAEAQRYAEALGDILAECYKTHITKDILPTGRLDLDSAQKILRPTLGKNKELIDFVSREVQEELNRQSGIGLKALTPKKNNSRIEGLAQKVSSYDDYDEAKWVLEESITNYSQSIVDDWVKENAAFQYKSGLKPTIQRIVVGGCCEWCSELAGTYDYPDIPHDVYRRHRFCRCQVVYKPGKGKAQDVHTKKWE